MEKLMIIRNMQGGRGKSVMVMMLDSACKNVSKLMVPNSILR
jgi:hypothetical protein